ncbi:MAG TPA: beta-ketoacyl-ACP synthase III [Noviherbaspirillum sp.]|nr:beta-ketoacyl-ACP synthase III [Noviherbaspirillum sp.]
MYRAIISGTGIYIPEHIITNAELVESFNKYVALYNARNAARIEAGELVALQESSVEFIEKASGIKQRYVLEKTGVLDPERMYPRFVPRPDEELSLEAEIAVAACRDAMAAAGKTAADIDMVICAAANMQRPYPAMAIEIQNELGINGFGFDLNVACSSATFGIQQAVDAVRCGSARAVLVVNPEITSAHLEWRDRDCHFIFGDVATAVVVERAELASPSAANKWEVLGTKLATQFSNNIRNNFGFMNSAEDSDPNARDKKFRQEGRKVFKEVVPVAAAHIESQLTSFDIKPNDVRRYWLHQANLGMNQLVGKKLLGREASAEEAPIILDEFANTASAGSIIAFHRHHDGLAAGDLGVICSFGAGYSVGSVVLRKL